MQHMFQMQVFQGIHVSEIIGHDGTIMRLVGIIYLYRTLETGVTAAVVAATGFALILLLCFCSSSSSFVQVIIRSNSQLCP